ncbi:hypothetical protein CBR_g20088 [Chara braunii]|uniref:Uncharacterized protein n=1 Tax=Chara braunii TaxID=69332 RepID=A0A388KZH0_CHABU|nr:hypothetical protein CBR_g20088 [Chara braunii]|eukprot:GBG75457.1 hypothetical protein CBR_g20088 [Chara braunii]
MPDCHAFVKRARLFFEKYTELKFRENGVKRRKKRPDVALWEELVNLSLPEEFGDELLCFLLFDSNSELKTRFGCGGMELGRWFSRWGKNVKHENDKDLAKRLYRYGRSASKKAIGSDVIDLELHQIDFDLIGSDGQHFPLRMLLWEGDLLRDVSWCAKVHDRENGVLIADAINKMNRDECPDEDWSLLGTKVRSRAGNAIAQRYKPHGNIPTLLKEMCCWSSSADYDFDEESLSDGSLHIEEEDLHDPTMFPKITPEQLTSLEDLKKVSLCNPNSIVYSNRSEFERLIPVAANLGPVLRESCCTSEGFQGIADEYGLRPSSLKHVMDFQCKHFQRLFRGTIWQQLPVDLMLRIVAFLPQRYIRLTPAQRCTHAKSQQCSSGHPLKLE